MKESSLILEGGGMRGTFTSGVLDAFLDNKIYFNNVYAVSAGCYNALSYLSRQKGRSYRINSTYLKDKRYISFKRLITKGSAINTDFIFNEVFDELDPFDYETFKNNCNKFYAVSTNCLTGDPYYALIRDLKEDVEYVKASAALPLFTKLVRINDLVLTDGGVSDSIPISKAIEDGFTNNIIVLTRPKGFIMGDNKLMKYYKVRHRNYPNLLKTMEDRKNKYNQTLQFIEKLEEENKAIVIRPGVDLNIGNLEKNQEKIERIYNYGYEEGIKCIKRIKKFVKVKENEKEN